MLHDTGIDDVKKQRNAEYAKHINDSVLSSLKMEGIRLLFQQSLNVSTNFSKKTKYESRKSIRRESTSACGRTDIHTY
jgi:hypothetical protein